VNVVVVELVVEVVLLDVAQASVIKARPRISGNFAQRHGVIVREGFETRSDNRASDIHHSWHSSWSQS
jgi:hypothetical protein